MTRLASWVVAAGIAAGGALAHADPATTAAPQPSSLVLPGGKLLLDVYVEMNMSATDAAAGTGVFKPVSFTPDLWYGVTDGLTLGLVHSSTGAIGFIGDVGNSLCLTGANDGCAHFYPDVGLDARIRLVRPLALDLGVYAVDTDPFQLAFKVGISGRWVWGPLLFEVQPNLFVGATNREPPAVVGMPLPPTNTEQLNIPLTLGFLATPRLEFALQSGAIITFTNTSSTWAIPVAIAVRFAITPRFGLGLAFAFPELGGGANTTNIRTLTLGGTYAF
jgi:hypothetical protein